MTSVLCVGECMIELTHIDERTLRRGFGGDTYNTAVYLRRVSAQLGADLDVGYLSGVGVDHYSDAMRRAWKAESIADRALTVAGRLPGLYTIETSPAGERQFTYWRHGSAAGQMFRGNDWIRHVRGDLVHLSGITLQLMSWLSRDALLYRLHNLRAEGTRISFDTNYRPRGWASTAEAAAAMDELCEVAHVVFVSREDDEALHGARSADEIVARLRKLGAEEVVLRDGAAGAHVITGDDLEHIPAQPVARVVDTTGAGDAFAGAYLAARLAGEPPEQAGAVGNAVAAVVIQHPGALTPIDTALVPLSSH